MAEYIEREAAYKLAKRIVDIVRKNEIPTCVLGQKILDLIDDIPATDVVQVVRCKDCEIQQHCKVAQYLGMDGFCSNGAKMDEEDK